MYIIDEINHQKNRHMQKPCIFFKPLTAGVTFIPPQTVGNSCLNKDVIDFHSLNLNFASVNAANRM